MINIDNDFSILELATAYKISVRSVNVCMSNGLDTLNKIINFYQKNGSFLNLRNCGEKSNLELIAICNTPDVSSPKVTNAEATKDNSIEVVNQFSPFKKAALNRHMEYLCSQLTVRARNGISNLIGENKSNIALIEKIFSSEFDFYDIRNIGDKSVSELIDFKENISSFISTLKFLEDSQLSREYAKLIIKTSFNKLPTDLEKSLDNVFDNNEKLKLFKLIQILAANDLLFNRNEKELFYYCYTSSNTKTLEVIANELDITKERSRQIKVNLENEIKSYFKFLSNFNKDDIFNYGIELNRDVIIIDAVFEEKVNNLENVNFNTHFYSIIFILLNEKDYSVFGTDEILITKDKRTNNKRFINRYLINNQLYERFNFLEFINSVNSILHERITEDYLLHFKGYISQFVKEETQIDLSQIVEICEKVLFEEFELVINNNGYLCFERNTMKQLVDYVYEALEELKEMSKVEIITSTIQQKYPELEISNQSVRTSLQRDRQQFIYIGRTSTYGLRKWEFERDDLKGGTIRDLAEEYLKNFSEPQKVKQITLYILKFRPNTYERSVMDNLKADKSGKFLFLGKGLVGLKYINYPAHINCYKPKLKTWEEKYKELKDFRNKNPHKWPSAISEGKEERLLYTFIYKNKKAIQKNTLAAHRLELLKEINFPLKAHVEREDDWYTVLERLKIFIDANKRIPSANSIIKSERSLYRYYYVNNKKMINGGLEDGKAKLFNTIKRMINE